MAIIPIRDVPGNPVQPSGNELILIDNGIVMQKATINDAVEPKATEIVDDKIADLELGTAAQADISDFATAAQGALADTAVQPGDLATVATTGSYADLSNKPLTNPPGGLAGQVLTKQSSTDGDYIWDTPAGTGDMVRSIYDPRGIEGDAFPYNSKAEIEAATIPSTVQAIRLLGYTAAGDGGAALYKRVAIEPSHGGKIQSADGAWWEITNATLSQDYAKSNLSVAPDVDVFSGGDLTASPSGTPYFNVIVGHGAKTTGDIWRSTIQGALAGTMLEEAERVEAYGNGAMRFAKYGQRVTAIGSLTLQWLGQEKAELENLFHDLWWPTPPSDAGWDAGGLETRNPGIRTKLLNNSTEAANTDDVRGNVAIGRDSSLCLINGIFNTTVGYRAGARAVNANNIVAIGRDALTDNVLADYNTAVGSTAGMEHQEGNVNVYVGYNAGTNHVTGLGNVMVGGGAGFGWTDGDRNVLIGYQAGQGVTQADDILAIQNLSTRNPLVSGRFNHGAAGINIKPQDIAGTFHVRTGVGSGALVNAAADDLIVDVAGTGGITIGNGSSDSATLYFANPSSNRAGGLLYAHSTGVLAFYAGTVQRMQITNDGLRLLTLPTSSAGLSSGQIWNDNGTLKVA